MKLLISEEGLFEPIKYMLNDTVSSLRNAKQTAINPPSGFSYASYVRNLDTLIDEYIRETNYITNAINRVDKNYQEQLANCKRKIQVLKEEKIRERTGLKL